MIRLLTFISILILSSCTAIKYPKSTAQYKRKCGDFNKQSKKLIGSNVFQKDGSVFINLNPEKVGRQMFKKRRDGIMLEIVGQDQFACDTVSPGPDQIVYGFLLDPVFKKEIFKNYWPHPYYQNAFIFKAGGLPDGLDKVSHEINILFIKRRFICQKVIITDVPSHKLDLLETGLYPFELSEDSLGKIAEKGLTSEFVLHYQKGKAQIEKEQLDFLLEEIRSIKHIQRFTVTGYASIDGSRKINRQLFNKRTEEIATEINTLFPGIPVETHADENWEDFIVDIEQTPYAFLASQNKSAIKRLMDKRGLYKELEPILENHRKVVIEVNAKLAVEEWSEEEIKHQYQSAYQEADLSRLLFIQKQVMKRIRNYELPETFAKELNVPLRSELGAVVQNQLINLYELKFKDLSNTHANMEELYKLMPKEPQVIYNLAALKIMLLTTRPAEVN